jgi:hypothetical protein
MSEPPSRNMSQPLFPPGPPSPYPGSPVQGGQWGPVTPYPISNQPPSTGALNGNQPPFRPPTGTLNGGQQPPFRPPTGTLNAGPGQPAAQPFGSAQNLPPWQQGYGSGMNYPSPPGMPGMSGINYNNQRGPAPVPTKPQKKHIFSRAHQKYKGFSKPVKALCLVLVAILLFSSMTGIFEIINGVILYNQIQGGMNHLRAAGAVFQGGTKGDNSKYFDVAKLKQAQVEINAAHASFAALSDELDNDGSLALAGSLVPSQMTSLRRLGHIAADGTAAAQMAVQTAIEIAPVVGPGLKAEKNPSKPYLDQASYDKVIALLTSLQPLVHDMSNYAQGVSLSGLPLSASQNSMLSTLLTIIPVADNVLGQVPQYKDALSWLLGIGSQRTILISPMDSAELRSTGGFTGQFGELTFTGAHMAPLNLKNLGAYEEDHSNLPGGAAPIDQGVYNRTVGQTAPDPYSEWWPFGNFGMRDANVSADFPTSAQIIINAYEREFLKNADGMIVFTPNLIQQILHVTGPIKISGYNETVTDQNLEAKLHYYQLDNTGIRKEEIVGHQSDPELARKLFTQSVTQQLMLSVIHLPINKLVPMAAQMWQATKTKDLQIYFTNSQLEGLIAKYGSTATMDRSNSHDGLFVVQSNDSASKASQYVSTTLQDSVMVDAQGTATHNLTMTLNYQQKGSVYGADTYRDYVRIYVPQNSTLLDGNGFTQIQSPYCGDNSGGCQPDVYGDGTLVCTPPVTVGGAVGYNANFPDSGFQLYQTGGPTNTISDEAGKAMFAGWVIVPKNCVMKVTVSWTVPPLSPNYNLLVQAQAGIDTKLNLTINTASCSSKALQYTGTLHGENAQFNVQNGGSSCTLQNKAAW